MILNQSAKKTETLLLAAALLSGYKELGDSSRLGALAALASREDPDDSSLLTLLPDALDRIISPKDKKGPLVLNSRGKHMATAQKQARGWMERRVSIFYPKSSGLPPLLLAEGDLSLMFDRKAAVLNSRKSRRISYRDTWIKVTEKMIDLAVTHKTNLITSHGNPQYELTWHLAAKAGLNVIIVCESHLPAMWPDKKRKAFSAKYASFLAAGRFLFISAFPPGPLPKPAEIKFRRDEVLVNIADMILAAEIRSKGHMERLTRTALSKNIPVIVYRPEKFGPDNQGNRILLDLGAKPFDTPAEKPDITKPPVIKKPSLAQPDYKKYLFHFTRLCPGPWPVQDLFEYYRSLTEGDKNSAHTAFDTLKNILKEKMIWASGRMTRGQIDVVSFTSRPPDDLTGLIRWRRGLIRWTMEPYGLGVDKKYLIGLGAAPAIYGDESLWRRLPQNQKFRFQLHQPPKTDWSAEREWRLAKSLDLSEIPIELILVVVPTLDEAAEIAKQHGLNVTLASPEFRRVQTGGNS